MKWTMLLAAVAAATFVGCAANDYAYDDDFGRDRTYVRDYDASPYRDSIYNQNAMEPRVRGKHADALGWNTESYYLQRGYKW
jgi:hypothetical protein